MNNMHYSNIF